MQMMGKLLAILFLLFLDTSLFLNCLIHTILRISSSNWRFAGILLTHELAVGEIFSSGRLSAVEFVVGEVFVSDKLTPLN